MAKGGNTVKIVRDLVEPFAKELGLDIWDVRFLKEGADWYLRIFIDKDGGVSIDDCVDLTHAINKPLDEADPIEQAYFLEVSSPGIERELKNEMHISACEGWQVEVKLYAPINGAKVFKGILCECPEGKIIIENGEGKLEFEASSVAKINTVYDFGADD